MLTPDGEHAVGRHEKNNSAADSVVDCDVQGSVRAESERPEDAVVRAAEQWEYGEGHQSISLRLRISIARCGARGNAEAAYRLGWMYFNGRGTERNDRLAAGLFALARERGYSFAQVYFTALKKRNAGASILHDSAARKNIPRNIST